VRGHAHAFREKKQVDRHRGERQRQGQTKKKRGGSGRINHCSLWFRKNYERKGSGKPKNNDWEKKRLGSLHDYREQCNDQGVSTEWRGGGKTNQSISELMNLVSICYVDLSREHALFPRGKGRSKGKKG